MTFTHVKGHSGDEGNERADVLAKHGAAGHCCHVGQFPYVPATPAARIPQFPYVAATPAARPSVPSHTLGPHPSVPSHTLGPQPSVPSHTLDPQPSVPLRSSHTLSAQPVQT